MLSIKVSSSTLQAMGLTEGKYQFMLEELQRVKRIERPHFPRSLWAFKQEAEGKQGRGEQELGKKKARHTMGGEELCPFGMVGTC